ncbi:D-isomer specific 2-hydroxyacid dehydrogenase family protein [Gordonia alkaliphila]|uniref:D-isomer specific 2-hydroxyacid dehydrogenase family protein n=1 Tax=Gordonia alkaliphila TaxID=1053547 RepID=UPI001FF6FA73|nr:D-isomer specific 2-hydroxyacid dehydrogenase family protein [Gordonia alkaliphila]MCK0439179.1 D-isomer specific 2-hydroxyacid dehydrogenase family protein [Gordonia alkaliphila]
MSSDASVPLPVAIEPEQDRHLVAAVEAGGGVVVPLSEARALVWIGPPADFPTLPDTIEWVALKTAGIEGFKDAGVLDDRRRWTNASGFYAAGCAEHALALLLAGLRQIPASVLLGWNDDVIPPRVRTLRGATVAIIGAGGIGRELAPRLRACGATVIAVNRSGRPVEGADRTVSAEYTEQVLTDTDHVVLAAPSTAATRHLLNDRTLALLKPHSWVVNVARGSLIDQEALGRALRAGTIAGAALDVTDPEPPADDDPLYSYPNLILTPHIANPAPGLTREMAPWLAENVRRFIAGEELLSVVDPAADY